MKEKSSRETIWDTICDLHSKGQVASRTLLVDLTGLKFGVVDDHCSAMIEDMELLRIAPGVFEPMPQYRQAEAVSTTMLPNNILKVEIGDKVMDLVPKEYRALGQLMAGYGMEFSNIQSGREAAKIATMLEMELRAVKKQASELAARLAKFEKESPQLALDLETSK